ncbi:MAG: hypothetical protein IPL52_04360 [Flavobacteriales bacterium]|nr:hypothetical protein [Flavobacteriales bacterium]
MVYHTASCAPCYLRLSSLLVPFIGHAQDTLPNFMVDHAYFGPASFRDPQDSADFLHFRKGLRTVQPTGTKDTTNVQYRMVWREDQHGGLWSVSRGDSSLWQARAYESLDLFMGGTFVTADGRRGVLVVHDIPCGLICRNARYYVED